MFKLLAIYFSLLSCSPGGELYTRYGHTAIRMQDTERGVDVVFNYGVFSFDTENFYYKFVKGETYYQLGIEPTRFFMMDYDAEKRPVYEQRLKLTDEQSAALAKALAINYKPSNRNYLYNFVFDNCATRPYNLIKSVLGDTIVSDYTEWEGCTYREFLQHFTGRGTWEDFGINMIFGRRADIRMHGEDRLFLPEALMFHMQSAHLPDGTPVVEPCDIAPFVIAKTPWYKTWYFGVGLFVLFMLTVSLIDLRRNKWSWWWDLPFVLVYVLMFAIAVFLTFFSIHPLVGFNWRLFLFPVIHLCLRLIYILR